MKVWVVVAVSLVLGIAAGVGATMLELGVNPSGTLGSEDPLALAQRLAQSQGPQSRVVVDQAEYDFGTMNYDATEKHSFLVKNVGTAPLELEQLSTTCKCTLGTLGQDKVPPGGSTEVELEWTANTPPGPFRQSATIQTNDPRRPRVTLTVVGRVVRTFDLSPQRLVFSSLTADSSQSQAVQLSTGQTEAIAVEGVEFSNPETQDFFDVKIGNPVGPDDLPEDAKSGLPITVTVKPGLPLEPIRQTIRLRTNLPDAPVVELPIEGTVRGDILVAGPRSWSADANLLFLGDNGIVQSEDGYVVDLKLIVRGPHQDQVQFEPVRVEPELLQVTVGEPVKTGNITQVPLRVEVPPGAPAVNHSGTQLGDHGEIVLSTGHPQTKELRMKVRFIVEKELP